MAIDFSKYGEPVKSPVTKVEPSDYSKYGVVSETPVEAIPEDQPSKVVDTAKNVGGGSVYSFSAPGRTIQNLLSKGVEKLTGIKDFGKASKEGFEQSTGTDLDTTSGKVGQFAGEVATFAIPAGFAAKATRGAGILAKIGAQGLSDATVQSLNQGEINKNTIDAGIVGAIFPAGGMALSSLKKEFAPRVVNSLIKPLLKDFSYGKNPGKAVAEAGITANSLEDLVGKIRIARQAVGDSISKQIEGSNAVFTVTDAFKPIDDAIADASKSPRTNAAIISRLQALKDDIFGVAMVDGQEIVTRNMDGLSAQEVFDLKREVGELTRWTGNASDDEIVNKALKRTYGALKGKLDESIPAIKELNENYADLKSAEIATEYRDKIAARQNLISFTGANTGIGAGIVTAIATGGVTVPLLVGAGVAGLTQAARTPAVKTRLAAWLASAGKEEVKSAFQQAPWLRGALQSILFGEESSDTNNGE